VAEAAANGDTDLEDYGPAPDFAGIASWVNSEPLTMEELRGKVVVLDFWTYSCINCLRTLPYLKRWDEAYRDKGLVLVGVHTPEFAFERDRSNVEDAVERLGLEYPVALDSDYGTWEAWENRYWPAKYFVDREGRVRYAHFGEGEYAESEAVIRELLAEPGLPEMVSNDVTAPQASMDVGTPETYLGYGRLDRFSGSPVQPDEEATYSFPAYLPPNGLAYSGRWTVEEERIVAGADARLRMGFRSRSVNLVLGVAERVGAVEVFVDGKRLRRVEVRRDDLYPLASLPGPAKEHVLELRFAPGTEAYAFTFG
jgi:thiol-disulfide isomerase/thioredoxin